MEGQLYQRGKANLVPAVRRIHFVGMARAVTTLSLGMLAGVVILSGCSRSANASPYLRGRVTEPDRERARSWMFPEAKNDNLLYTRGVFAGRRPKVPGGRHGLEPGNASRRQRKHFERTRSN